MPVWSADEWVCPMAVDRGGGKLGDVDAMTLIVLERLERNQNDAAA